jgi:CIC family chloride channel protein
VSGPTARSPPAEAAELSDFATANRRLLFLAAAAAGIGVVAAFIAVALLDLIGFFTNLFYYGRISVSFASPSGNSLGWFAIGVPVLGGLIVGGMARFGSERIRGHGIPEAIEAILVNKSRIEPKVTVLKPVASAISIGSGGPFGAEGPIIMTAGSFGSVVGQLLRITAYERRTFLVAGAAAGMAATFNSPLAAVLLSVELLLFEWRPQSLLPVGAAVVVATAVRWEIVSANPLFPIPATAAPTATTLVAALALGLVAGVASALLTRAVYAAEDGFRKLPIHWMFWPALGGLVIGIGGVFAPRALGVGYNSIDAMLLVQLGAVTVLTLLIVKAVIWSISLGSGTSGGVVAPLMILGGAIGGLMALVLPGGSAPLFVVVGIGAMIGGTMRVPFTGVVFALELTHDFNALLPLLVAAFAADALTVLVLRRSILTEKVARRGVHVSREYGVDPLDRVAVRSVMRTSVRTVPAGLSVEELLMVTFDPESRESGAALVDDEGRASGFLARSDLRRFLELGGDPQSPAQRLVSNPNVVCRPDEPVRIAAERLAACGASALPVVDPSDPSQVVGFLTREAPFESRVQWATLERERERVIVLPAPWRAYGWLRERWGRGSP